MNKQACAIVDGKPYFSMTLPPNVKFVGMESEPNRPSRYGKPYHPWFNLPCYESDERIPGGKEQHNV